MAEALYRKYRPNTFGEVAEQGHVVRTVTNQLRDGKVAHAYLFAGPRGVGKTTIARLLAKALNCEGRQPGESEPCNQCGSCREMKQGLMMDVVEIDAASQTKVEETRENIIENVRFAPTRGKFKVFIIDEVHMLSTASFNALLKTLEEPPSHAIFILATTELHKIPATIISRCQRFDFHRVPPKEMIERLEKIAALEGKTVAPSVLASIARLSEGCLRDAESLLGQLFSLGENTIDEEEASLILPATHTGTVAEIADAVVRKDVQTALSAVTMFVEGGGSLRHLIDELLEYVRSLLFASLGFLATEDYDPETLKKLHETAKLASPDVHRKFLDLLLTARMRPSISALPQIPLEIALVEATKGGETPLQQPPQRAAEPTFRPSEIDLPPLLEEPKAPQTASLPSASSSTLPFTLLELADKWGRCCAYVGERNVALPLVLSASKPIAVEGDTVTVSFAYQFHVKTMEEQKNARLLQEAIGSVMQVMPAKIVCVLEKGKESDPVDTLVEAFGGQVM